MSLTKISAEPVSPPRQQLFNSGSIGTVVSQLRCLMSTQPWAHWVSPFISFAVFKPGNQIVLEKYNPFFFFFFKYSELWHMIKEKVRSLSPGVTFAIILPLLCYALFYPLGLDFKHPIYRPCF